MNIIYLFIYLFIYMPWISYIFKHKVPTWSAVFPGLYDSVYSMMLNEQASDIFRKQLFMVKLIYTQVQSN